MEGKSLMSSNDGSYENRASELLAILRSPPESYPGCWKQQKESEPLWQGKLYKQRRNGRWKEFVFKLYSGLLLSYANTAEDKPRRTLPCAFCSLTVLESEDALVTQQVIQSTESGDGKTAEFCRSRLYVFTPSRTYTFGAENDEVLEECYEALQRVMSVFTSSEEASKRAALRELAPLMAAQREAQLADSVALYNTLDNLGMLSDTHGSTSAWFTQQGRLDLLEHVDGSSMFKTYYFGIRKHFMLYYEDSSDHRTPIGTISLAAASVRRPTPDTSSEVTSAVGLENGTPNVPGDILGQSLNRSDSGTGVLFEVVTPMRTFILRAPAELLVTDWAKAIRDGSKTGAEVVQSEVETSGTKVKKFIRSTSGYQQVAAPQEKLSFDGDDEDMSFQDPSLVFELVYTVHKHGRDKETRKKVSADKPIHIGRLSTNDIVTSDPQCSRSHARVLVKGDEVYLYDLGSRIGTQVNGVAIEHRRLLDGDEIEVGDTKLKLRITRKDPKGCSLM